LAGPHWFVSGDVGFEVSGEILAATLSRLTEIGSPSIVSSTPGPFRLESRDADGQVLDFVEFELQPVITACMGCRVGGEVEPKASFAKCLPINPEAASIVLLATGEELDRIESSLNIPTVLVLFPNGGETLSSTFTISWDGSDADEDRLTYQVDWSRNNGNTWEPLSGRVASTKMEVNPALLPGGTECLVRVSVTDGFLTSHDVSDLPFTVPDSSPEVGIISPQDGDTFNPGDAVFFLGYGDDPETGSLEGEQLIWTSDLNGVLGHGPQIASATLAPGTHTVTLTAVDPAENVSSTTIQLLVNAEPEFGMSLPGDWNADGVLDRRDLFEFSRHWEEGSIGKAADEESLLQLMRLLRLLR
jgi:hypothetical protein